MDWQWDHRLHEQSIPECNELIKNCRDFSFNNKIPLRFLASRVEFLVNTAKFRIFIEKWILGALVIDVVWFEGIKAVMRFRYSTRCRLSHDLFNWLFSGTYSSYVRLYTYIYMTYCGRDLGTFGCCVPSYRIATTSIFNASLVLAREPPKALPIHKEHIYPWLRCKCCFLYVHTEYIYTSVEQATPTMYRMSFVSIKINFTLCGLCTAHLHVNLIKFHIP